MSDTIAERLHKIWHDIKNLDSNKNPDEVRGRLRKMYTTYDPVEQFSILLKLVICEAEKTNMYSRIFDRYNDKEDVILFSDYLTGVMDIHGSENRYKEVFIRIKELYTNIDNLQNHSLGKRLGKHDADQAVKEYKNEDKERNNLKDSEEHPQRQKCIVIYSPSYIVAKSLKKTLDVLIGNNYSIIIPPTNQRINNYLKQEQQNHLSVSLIYIAYKDSAYEIIQNTRDFRKVWEGSLLILCESRKKHSELIKLCLIGDDPPKYKFENTSGHKSLYGAVNIVEIIRHIENDNGLALEVWYDMLDSGKVHKIINACQDIESKIANDRPVDFENLCYRVAHIRTMMKEVNWSTLVSHDQMNDIRELMSDGRTFNKCDDILNYLNNIQSIVNGIGYE